MQNTKTDCSRRFKTRILKLDREIGNSKRELSKLNRLEERSRNVWTKAYHVFLNAARQLSELQRHGTKKEEALKSKIKRWPAETARLTAVRDAHRAKIKEEEKRLVVLGTQQASMLEQQTSEVKAVNEIVTQVFSLNDAVIAASSAREGCLNRHVFPRLVDESGNLRSQISFTSFDGLRRVVAMVNTMTIVRGDLAGEAKSDIEKFFARFEKVATLDQSIKPLYDLTRQLLVEKTNFKVGPDLYRFLAMELDADIYPELSRAQTLLRQSIRSEKTTSYIRLYWRESRTSNWEVVAQS